MERTRRGPRSLRRAGATVRRDLRREILERALTRRSQLAALAACWLIATVGILVFLRATGGSVTATAFVAGVAVGFLPGIALMIKIQWGFAHRQMGGEAEQWTARELTKLDSGRWVVFHDVPLAYANVDHVAIGPGRVYAVETKWTSYASQESIIDRHAGQAAQRARELARRLAERGVDREVIPLLVVWGPDVLRHIGDRTRQIGTTRVVVGVNSGDWLPRMEVAADGASADGSVSNAVAAMCTESGVV